ncbi:hypothetical protein K469DRAFT_718786 [Zopfia rhizophila CBS 207.26]|uniref:Uncharacterized protein n=1 Tax=Zopfia rhizophila CBS 207.26 TaxID=1314779 RepID=A0A6A6EKU3_9PEZI|nr:hypothetical protein K469DRAFT_718786 [Zopfia rhizophila CBS 207.26]
MYGRIIFLVTSLTLSTLAAPIPVASSNSLNLGTVVNARPVLALRGVIQPDTPQESSNIDEVSTFDQIRRGVIQPDTPQESSNIDEVSTFDPI